MKRRLTLLGVTLLALPLLVWAFPIQQQKQWEKVTKAVNKGLPRTAIKHLEPIIANAIKNKDYPEAIKALAKKIALEGNIQGNHPEERIFRMEAEIAKAPKEMRPVMDAILANWYWHYFQRNRWRFVNRTATAEVPGKDIRTWDLPRIMSEIDKQFTKTLASHQELKKIRVGDYNKLLVKGNVPDKYRPTLYDFIAHNALQFYSAGEQAGSRSSDAFDLNADSPIFASAEDFLKWKINSTDKTSPALKAIRIYKDLLTFHQNDDDKTAFADADLLRYNFGNNKAFGESKNARYKLALERFAEIWNNHEISARAQASWASVLRQEGKLVEARKLALKGTKAFPNSHGGKLCYNIVKQIEAKSSQVTAERVWNNPWPEIEVRYRNLTKVYFRAVDYDFAKRIAGRRSRPDQLNRNERLALLKKMPAHAWSADLPATPDYQERVQKLKVPKALKPGSYFLISSHDAQFRGGDNVVTYTNFWVSKLALVTRTHNSHGILEGFVLDALNGTPIAGAKVRAWSYNYNRAPIELKATVSDQNGLFRFTGNRLNYLVLADHQGEQLATSQNYHLYRYKTQPDPYLRTVFFTDRSLYRPGQTIRYQGISINVNQDKDNYKALANRELTVVFADRNNKEIARAKHRTNDYGAFNGSFTAPRGRVSGRATIRVDGQPQGSTGFNVEEYKRPKFQVTVDKPKKAAKLNGQVDVAGKATAYTGAPINGAKVRYRVVRQVRYPIWRCFCCWWMPPQPQNQQEIAHGFAKTEMDGSFRVQFTALPDLSVPEKDEPTFHYTVYADVTDTTGETRSGQTSLNVGYTALKATMSVDDWQTTAKAVKLKINTATLDGEGQKANVLVKIYRLKQPDKVHRATLYNPYRTYGRGGPYAQHQKPEPDLSNPLSWELGKVVATKGLATDAKGNAELKAKLDAGVYRAKLETHDRFGKKVTAIQPIRVLDPGAMRLPIKVPNLVAAPKWSMEPGENFSALWGTGYGQGRAFIEIEHRHKVIDSYWTPAGQTQVTVNQAVTEAMRGGFTLRVTMVRENRAYTESRRVDVPWTNKNLTVKWGRFVSKLEPGQKETWTAHITGPDAKKAVAEMVATLYDESLDQYLKHQWQSGFGVFRQDHSHVSSRFENGRNSLQYVHGSWPSYHKNTSWSYRRFPHDITVNLWGYGYFGRAGGFGGGNMAPGAPALERQQFRRNTKGAAPADGLAGRLGGDEADRNANRGPGGLQQDQQGPNLDVVSPRKNLNETAFFFPQLLSTKDGEVVMQFTMPEALTKWKFMGFAYDKDLRSGFLTDSAVTSRDLMVQPIPPRFVRENDVLEFTVKVTNQADKEQSGKVRLTFADARTNEFVDAALGNTNSTKEFKIPAKQSRTFAWRLKVPDGMGFLTYKAVGSSGKLMDGEEGYLPVLSRRIFVTESMPFWIRGPQTKKYEFKRLSQSGSSETLEHKQVVVQAVSHPSWYAVMALPYLMEYPHQCSEQTFNRLYANALARHIAKSDPRIRKVFDQWKNTDALDSPLEKNEDLRSVMLEETPWLRQANNESQARRNVGILFDDNRLNFETARLMRKIADMQYADGAWPWFPGGRPNDYITLYITTGFGRMRHLGVKNDMQPAVKSLNRLDGWINRIYREIVRRGRKDKNNLSTTIALYLYGRSFFLQDRAVNAQHKEAVDYFLGQAQKHWLKLGHRQSQAHLALALNRFGFEKDAKGIMRSIKERSITSEELGMHWRDLELSWWWYRAPIETQAMMIEAFDEVMNDAKSVDECKVWLLLQKQTQDWKTTKATADAVYALLLRGPSPLVSGKLVDVTVGGNLLKPKKVEAGTGYFEKRYTAKEVKPDMGKITVDKVDKGLSWGSVHWQYLEDASKITSYDGTPLTLNKKLFTKVYTKKGPVLERVKDGALKVGDELVVRLVLRVDRDMEYVHLKDQRGSGTEPVNVLSKYRYQDGLAYFESTRDTASHFFIDYLPKGTYVFEYSTRVVHRGEYQTGLATIQSMYAPEFNSHSEGFMLRVR